MGSGRLLIVIPFIMSAMLALSLSAAAWRRVRSPGSLSFALATLSVCVWLFTAAMSISTTVEAEMVTWTKVAYLGIAWLAPFWLMFVMEYVYPAGRYATRFAAMLLVIPIITIGLVMTNEAHHLFWTQVSPTLINGEPRLTFHRGPWFWMFTGYSYSLLAASAVMLLRALRHKDKGRQHARRQQVLGLLAGMALPWVGNLLYLAGLLGPTIIDLTPFAFSISGLIFSWTLFRRGLFQVTPLAYETIIENISDGFLLFDRQSRLVEVNKAACHLLHLSIEKVLGQPAHSALRDWPDLLSLMNASQPVQIELPARGPAPETYLEASASTWLDLDRKAGKLIILHDITRRRQAEQRQRALAESLHDSAAALNSTLNLDEVLDRILSNLERVVPRVAANIALLDEDGDLRFVRWRGYDPAAEDLMRALRLGMDERYTYRMMIETGEPFVIADTWGEPGWVAHEPVKWIRSYAGAPIRGKDGVVGFINLDSPELGYFPEDLTNSLRVFADQAAVAIENARLFDAAHRRADEMSILYRTGLKLTAGLEIDQVLVALYEECRQVLPVDVFSVALYDAESGNIGMPLYFSDNIPQTIPGRNIYDKPSLTGEVIHQRRTMYLPDTTDRLIEESYGVMRLGGRPTRSYVGVPLILIDQVVGVISMQSYAPHAYKPEQIRLLETIATQAAIAVQNTQLFEQMRQMAITDAVTGLNTRRHFTSLGRSEIERALRYDRKCSVLMVDLDHFKRVNDTYGHNTGDQVLKTVAEVCRQALRATDIVGRWGGEEFAIMLPEADRDGAALIAERIRRMMAERDIIAGTDIIRVMVSIGVATLDANCCSLEVLIDSADRALYMAKQAGRNQVVCV